MSGSDRLFNVVFVRPPSKAYVDCVSTNPERGSIDLALALQQHRTYVSLLKESGVLVSELPPLPAYPDSVFMQDPALLGSDLSVVGRFGEETRRGEEKAFVDDLRSCRTATGSLNFVREPGTLEGGDILVTETEVFVGESQRTNSGGIHQLTEMLSNRQVTSVRVRLMHLLCGCSYLSKRTMIIAPDLVSPDSFPGFKFIRIPAEEGYAADTLYLGEGTVLVPSGFPVTISKLRAAGYKPIEIDMSEFQKGDGGVTCLSSPVYESL